MKLMLASDIHGSAYYAEKMRAAYINENAERLILLGDLLYHGPRNDLPKDYEPKKVIEILNGMKNEILCVRGNCDTEVDQMVLDFPIMADYAVIYVDGKTMYLTHGHKFNPDNPPKMKMGDYLINGHTHIPANENRRDFIYINTGSVSIPKGGSGHTYMIYENGEFILKEL
ncbi:MAG: phosphodiesterase [Oscillospiraceae bacterium]|nr:phosphodiesterase [Oscillospiraceae bacterium]